MALLIAATELELCGNPGLVCGVGPVEAAAATARGLAADPPAAVLHVGVAGGSGLEPGTLVVGTESLYMDIAAAIPVVSRVEPEAALLAAVRAALPDALALPIATSAAVGRLCGSEPQGAFASRVASTQGESAQGESAQGESAQREVERLRGSEPQGVLAQGTEGATHRVEAMEGFAVLRACELAGVPAVEVRAVSNELGEEDRSRWDIPRALEALAEALPRLLASLPK